MSKIINISGKCCIVCGDDVSENGITLHKTRRQKHCMCSECFVSYINTQLPILLENCRNKNNRLDLFISCPGTYTGKERNRCSCKLDINYLAKILPNNISEEFKLDFFRIQVALGIPLTHLCKNKNCKNISIIEDDYKFTEIKCCACYTTWCKNCGTTPYHTAKTCLENELDESKGENVKYILELKEQKKLKFCPDCKVPVIKFDGCNKMHCDQCHCKWCWLCQEKNIDYPHFNYLNNGGCSGKLYEV